MSFGPESTSSVSNPPDRAVAPSLGDSRSSAVLGDSDPEELTAGIAVRHEAFIY